MAYTYKSSFVLCALSCFALYADAPPRTEFTPEEPMIVVQEALPTPAAPEHRTEAPTIKPQPQKAPAAPFSSFTGKVKGTHVRIRLQPDVESRIIKEVDKNTLLSVVGEKGDFWAVQAPSDTKAYVFRSFILDDVVEGNRVNIRLEPSLEAPIIGHLNAGDRVKGAISPINNKWLEISPDQAQFYIAKEYVDYAGGPELKAELDQKYAAAEQLLQAASLLSKAELAKSFEAIDFDRVCQDYNTLIADYADFTQLTEHATHALAAFQENYLAKRIAHVESQPQEIEEVAGSQLLHATQAITDRMKMWQPVEEAIYLSWATMHENRNLRQFYEDQKLTAQVISGTVEPYNSPIKAKPGDFIVRKDGLPVGYVYSTQINLQNLVGENVTMVVSPRPNNNFAFPAYYVIALQQGSSS